MPPEVGDMPLFEALRSHILVLPNLVKFAVIMAAIVGVPALTRRVRLPGVIGLLFFVVLMGPHVLGFFGQYWPKKPTSPASWASSY